MEASGGVNTCHTCIGSGKVRYYHGDLDTCPVCHGVGAHEGFQVGDLIEVLDTIRGVWIRAHVVNRWACVRLDDGKKFFEYDCDGVDDIGAFHGRFTDIYVRPRTTTP